jgi:hypothetical protein
MRINHSSSGCLHKSILTFSPEVWSGVVLVGGQERTTGFADAVHDSYYNLNSNYLHAK